MVVVGCYLLSIAFEKGVNGRFPELIIADFPWPLHSSSPCCLLLLCGMLQEVTRRFYLKNWVTKCGKCTLSVGSVRTSHDSLIYRYQWNWHTSFSDLPFDFLHQNTTATLPNSHMASLSGFSRKCIGRKGDLISDRSLFWQLSWLYRMTPWQWLLWWKGVAAKTASTAMSHTHSVHLWVPWSWLFDPITE